MSNANETITDIIAEMRALSSPISDGIIAINGRSIADRLEAAWKREKAEAEANALAVGGVVEASRATAEKSSVAGDTAKLRKACQKTRDLLMLRGDGKTMCILTWDEFNDTQKMLRSALAAPPRNCDLAHDWLQDLYCKFKPPASVRREMPPEWVDAVMAFCKWLVAQAKDTKGESDGSK